MEFLSTFDENTGSQDLKTMFETFKVIHYKPAGDIQPDAFYKSKAAALGIPLIYEEDPISGEIRINHWTEIRYIAEKVNDTYKHSNKYQPLHTDYGYFSFEIYASFFYCSEQADFGGATTFIDIDQVVEILRQTDPGLLEALQQTRISFGRNGHPIARNTDFILSRDALGWKINWNYYRAMDDLANGALVNDFRQFLDDNIEKSGELSSVKLLPGEAVFFHDRRVLHGRNSFIGERHLNKGGIATSVPEAVLQMLS